MFSIVIPLYNKEQSIVFTLQSIFKQTFHEFEVIIIDDGSTDESVNKVRKVFDNRIKICQKANGGVCSARNRGIEEAKFKYIAFLDGDDYWDPDYLSEQKKMIEDFPHAAMWGINFAPVINGKISPLETKLPEDFRGIVENYFSINRHSDLFCSSSVVIRKEAFEVAGIFDTRIKYSEDLDMWYRLILNFPVVFYDKIMVYYQHDAENRAMKKSHQLKYFLPYYVDKYTKYKDKNPVFYRFINRWSAVYIRHYYFNVKSEREDAMIAALKLDYPVLPVIYRCLFKPPYFIGRIAYMISSIKKNLMK